MTRRRPTIDRDRRTLSIPRRLMPSLLAMQTGTVAEPAAVAELRAGGIVSAGHLDPLASDLLDVITGPSLVVSVDVDRRPETPRLVTFWRTGDRAVVGTTDAKRRFHLTEIAADLLPFHLAQATGIRPLAQPHYEGSFVVPARVLAAAEETAGSDPARTESALVAAGIEPLWAERFLAALLLRRAVWTAESVWLRGIDGRGGVSLSVLDGGHAGYWRLGPSNPDAITVTPSGFDDLMRRIAALLPRTS
jgi:EspG family